MAFNPFHAFRRHQKVVFAALTIVCMLTFVMAGGSFAGGDFFSELTRWVTGRGRTHDLASVYGRHISDREIQELRQQRRVANEFMRTAVSQAQENIINNVQNSLSQFDEGVQKQLQEILLRRRFAAFSPREYLNNLRIYLMQLQLIERQLDTANKTDLMRTMRQLEAALQTDFWLFHSPKDNLYPEEDLYFAGSLSEQGLLDFLIWRQQADRLGIHLTTQDIAEQYRHETFNSFGAAQQLMRMLGVREQTLLTALGDEFRVRLAQAALLGFDPSSQVSDVPTSVAPYEFWEYYRRNRTELNLKLLPVPVQKFVDAVKDKPTEEELQALFDKYKDDEAAPDKETPGFKQPRRMRIAWVSAASDSAYYRKQAQDWLLSLVAATPSNPWLPLGLLDPFLNDYEALKWGQFRAPSLTAPDFASAFYGYRYLHRPENVAASAGQLLAAEITHAGALPLLVGLPSAAVAQSQKELAPIVAQEAQRRLPWDVALLSAGTAPQPLLALAGIWQYAGKIDQYLPLELVQGQVVGKFKDSLAETLLTSSLERFKTELETLRKEVETKKAKPAEIEKRLEKALQEHGWAHGASAQLQDQYQVNRDPQALAPLKEAYTKEPQYRDPKGKLFAQALFFGQPADQWKLYTPKELDVRPSLGVGEKKTFLYWKTDDQPAKVLTFAQARPEVEAAWRMEKARALARTKADELAKKARETHGDPLPILTEASKQYGNLIELDGVARWTKPGLTSRADAFAQYQPYSVPDDKIEYPLTWPNFVDPLLANLQQPGDTTVLADRPKATYYVIALTQRNAPSTADFYKDSVGNRQRLLGQLEGERQMEYRKAFLEQLRAEARLSVNEEALSRVKERPSLREE